LRRVSATGLDALVHEAGGTPLDLSGVAKRNGTSL